MNQVGEHRRRRARQDGGAARRLEGGHDGRQGPRPGQAVRGWRRLWLWLLVEQVALQELSFSAARNCTGF